MTGLVIEPEAGRLVLTRNHLKALTDQVAGRHVETELLRDLRESGAWRSGRVHPLLDPLLRTLANVRGRAGLRRWRQGARPVVEVVVGSGGVFVLPGGHEMSAPQEVRWFERPTSVARVLADLIAPPATTGPPPFNHEPRPWSDLVDAASQPYSETELCDLRWADGPKAPLRSVLVLAWKTSGGIVTVTPVADDGSSGDSETLVRCSPCHPLEVWSRLTVLTQRVGPAAAAESAPAADSPTPKSSPNPDDVEPFL